MMNKHVELRLLFLIPLLLFLFVPQGNAQENQITIDMKNASLKEIFNAVEKQTTYRFSYRDAIVDTQKGISISKTNANVSAILEEILAERNLGYNIVSAKSIVIFDKQKDLKTDQKPQRKITGKVIDPLGDPIVGASVSVRGTTVGSMTDVDGRFEILVPSNVNALQVSFIGMDTQEITLGDKTDFNIVMQDAAIAMDEVVVTALGIKRSQKALSYNAQQVSESDLTKNKDVNFVNALSGKVAGVTINASSSGVGGASKVVMRGTKGIAQSSQALYVIDGIPMFNLGGGGGTEFDSKGTTEAIADINPEDIESLTVLSGAAASALYGSNAANGVIIINTKKGKAGKTEVTVSQSTEFLKPFVMHKFQNRYGTGSILAKDPTTTDRSWGKLLNNSNYMGYSPKDDYLETGVITTESFTLSTGNEQNQTFLSAAAVNSDGMVPNNGYDRYNFTFRNTTSLLNDKMILEVGASYIKQKDKNMTNQGRYSNPLVTAYLLPRSADWDDIKMFEHYDTQRKINVQNWPQWTSEFTGQNPYWINYRNLRTNKRDRYMLNASASYKIFDWFSVSGRIRIDNAIADYKEKLYASSNKTLTEGSDKGFYGVRTDKDKQLYTDIMANITKNLTEDISLQANVGASLQDMRNNSEDVKGPISDKGVTNKFSLMNLDNANTKRLEAGWREQTQSIFASAELGYKGAYYLTLTGRNDWPSQLAGIKSTSSSFFYPSVGTSFVLSEIFDLPKEVSYLKLRGSFASVGLPFPRFLSSPTWEWDQASQTYKQKSNYPMSNLKPERTNSWEAGLTSRFFSNFNFDISLYSTKSFNQTFDPQMSVSSGYKQIYVQSGKVQNRGIEVSLGYDNSWKGFTWGSNFTFSANRNKILELVKNVAHPETGVIMNKDWLDMGGLSQAHFVLTEGGSLGDLYSLSDLQRDKDGNIYVNEKGELVVNSRVDNRIKLGSIFPKANMAWRNNFSWKGLDLSFMVSARLGGIVYSATQATLDLYGVSEASANARDNGGVTINGGDVINPEIWYSTIGGREGIPQYYTYSATNVRLQEASIGYTFSKKQLWNKAQITVSLIGRNLWMIYNKAPFDPESVATTSNYYQGIDYFMMPSTRNIGFNIRARF